MMAIKSWSDIRQVKPHRYGAVVEHGRHVATFNLRCQGSITACCKLFGVLAAEAVLLREALNVDDASQLVYLIKDGCRV